MPSSTSFLSYCPCCEIEWASFEELKNHCLRSYISSTWIRCRQDGCLGKFDSMEEYLLHIEGEHIVKRQKTRVFTVGSPATIEVDLESGHQDGDHPNNSPTCIRSPIHANSYYMEHASQLPLPSGYTASASNRPMSPDTNYKAEYVGCCGVFCFILLLLLVCMAWFAFWYYYDETEEKVLYPNTELLSKSYLYYKNKNL